MLVHRGISALIGSALWDTLAMINRSYSCGLVWTGMQIPCCIFNILWFPCWLPLKLNASLTIIVNQHITRFDRKMHVLLRLWVTGWRQYPYIMYYHDSCNISCTICDRIPFVSNIMSRRVPIAFSIKVVGVYTLEYTSNVILIHLNSIYITMRSRYEDNIKNLFFYINIKSS